MFKYYIHEMPLHDKVLPNNAWEHFEDIEWKINGAGSRLSDIIAKYRGEMVDILKWNEAENSDDETKLDGLIRELKNKKTLLETNLWKTPPCKIDLSNNTDITNFWKSIVDGTNPKLLWQPGDGWWSPTTTDVNIIKTKIQKLLKNIQFLHDDWNGTRDKKRKLFKGASTEMTNIWKTLKNPLISTLLDQTNPTKVKKNVEDFVKSVWKTKWNPFYILSTKLFDNSQREVAIRISLYLYCAYKITTDSTKISKALCNEINDFLDNQIEPNEIKKIKWLQNTKVELWYLEPEYDTLKDLNVKKTDEDLWSKDISVWGAALSDERDLKIDFENWIATWLERYEIDTSKIKIKDWDGNPIIVSLNDGTRDITSLFADIWNTKNADLSLEIWWKKLKIGKIVIDNLTWAPKFIIKFDDETTVKAAATAEWISMPKFPLDFSLNLKWIKNVKNWLKGCKASLTKKYKATLVLWGIAPITLSSQRERQATITNVSQVNRAIAEREADEELRERYKNSWWNIFDKANLFLRRNFIKDNLVYKKMKWKSWIDWSESGQSAAHRHQIEKQENLADNLSSLVDIDEVNYPQTRAKLDKLIDDFTWRKSIPPRKWWITEQNFKDDFEKILKEESGTVYDTSDPTWSNPNWKPISKIIKSNNLESLSTNILLQAKQFQAHQKMVYDIREHIIRKPGESDSAFDTWCRWEIGTYISTYDDIPDFLQQMWLSIDKVNDIKILKWHEGALAKIQAQSLKYRLQILDGWSEAYNVKKEWWRLTKAWKRFDDPTENSKFFKNHPHLKGIFWLIRWGGKAATMIGTWLALAPFWPLWVASWIGGMSAMTTLLKKKSHYENEHRSYQRMQATNLTDYRNKRTNLANEVAWMKWYEGRFWWKKKRIRDQYNDYVLTTQDQLLLTNTLVANIKTYLNKWTILTPTEKDELGKLLADWLARLDYHKETGQNFLWSDDPTLAEKEYKKLQNAIIWWMLRLKITDIKDLRTNLPYVTYYNTTKNTIEKWTGTGKEYNNQWYLKAKNRFNRISRKKAWIWALRAWAISFGLSYLASSLASWTKSTTSTTETSNTMHHGQEWWEYNLWDRQEHLFVSWDVNPTMNSVINSSTSEITWGTLYSSVDAARCSADFWARQLAQAQADLSAALSEVSWNANLVSAINNYVTDATNKIWMIPWLSAWNHDLAIARAIEAAKEWILQPIIESKNFSIKIDPTCLSWVDPWTIQSTWWAVGQWFRNMWIMWLDYIQTWTEEVVEHVTRAISIPLPSWSNTFWAPKSDPK